MSETSQEEILRLSVEANDIFMGRIWNRYDFRDALMIVSMLSAAIMINTNATEHELDDILESAKQMTINIYRVGIADREAAKRLN